MLQSHVAAFRAHVNQLDLPWPKPWRKNFSQFGAAMSFQGTLTVRGMARALAGPTKAMRACDRRLRAFIGNERLTEAVRDAALARHLRFVLARLPRSLQIPVMVDWTKVGENDLLWIQRPAKLDSKLGGVEWDWVE